MPYYAVGIFTTSQFKGYSRQDRQDLQDSDTFKTGNPNPANPVNPVYKKTAEGGNAPCLRGEKSTTRQRFSALKPLESGEP